MAVNLCSAFNTTLNTCTPKDLAPSYIQEVEISSAEKKFGSGSAMAEWLSGTAIINWQDMTNPMPANEGAIAFWFQYSNSTDDWLYRTTFGHTLSPLSLLIFQVRYEASTEQLRISVLMKNAGGTTVLDIWKDQDWAPDPFWHHAELDWLWNTGPSGGKTALFIDGEYQISSEAGNEASRESRNNVDLVWNKRTLSFMYMDDFTVTDTRLHPTTSNFDLPQNPLCICAANRPLTLGDRFGFPNNFGK